MAYNYFKGIPELPEYAREKRKRPPMVAVVDEDNCTCLLYTSPSPRD